jgi:WXXGXW repeat (2 copies)
MRRVLGIGISALLVLMWVPPALSQVEISVGFAPPALPIYDQPPCPEDGLIWVPGYWGWDGDDQDYYWVPGSWVEAPQTGLLWTPPWWGWENGVYLFHDGFWGPEVGWYGGINYGFGYFGHGFDGGRWDHDHFFYNTAVVHVNETVIRNVYVDRTVINNMTVINNHLSYNGGKGGISERPTTQEQRASQGRHFPPVQAQEQRRQMARSNPQLRASSNQGRPPIAATARPTEFQGSGVVAARQAGAPYNPPANRGSSHPGGNEIPHSAPANPAHARDLQPHHAPAPADDGAALKFEHPQQKMIEKQNQEHEKLQRQQEKEDQRAQQQKWNDQKKQQIEQRHQQETRQMEQRHQQQQERAKPSQAEHPPH